MTGTHPEDLANSAHPMRMAAEQLPAEMRDHLLPRFAETRCLADLAADEGVLIAWTRPRGVDFYLGWRLPSSPPRPLRNLDQQVTPYHGAMGAAEALIVLVCLVVPLAIVVAGVAGVRRHIAKQRAMEMRLARLEDATLDHHPG